MTVAIAERNDEFRSNLFRNVEGRKDGKTIMSQGVAGLDIESKTKILLAVKQHNAFDEDNDPYGEHDFGVVFLPDIPKCFWKIDYYESEACEYGTEDRLNAYRVLTIMLAEEY